jgi:hypothetical protein
MDVQASQAVVDLDSAAADVPENPAVPTWRGAHLPLLRRSASRERHRRTHQRERGRQRRSLGRYGLM